MELCGTRDDVRAIKGGRFVFGATALFPLPHRRVGSRLFVCVQCVCFLVYIEVCALRVAPLGETLRRPTVGALSFFYFFLEASAVAEDVVVVAFDESSSHELPSLSHYLPALKAPSFSVAPE